MKSYNKSFYSLSGVYDVSDAKVKQYVKANKKNIDKKEIYVRDKKGNLVPKYRKYRKEHYRWLSRFK